jgi:integrase
VLCNGLHELVQGSSQERPRISIDCSARGPVKDDEVRVAPINDTLLPILREWTKMAPPGEMLFPPTSGRGEHVRPHTLHRHLKLAVEACKLRRLTWYQATRHTFASHFVQDGGSIEKLAMILGHDSITTTLRYAHLAPGRFDQRDFGVACVDLSEAAAGYARVTIGVFEEEGRKGVFKKGVSRRHVAANLPA